MAVTESKLLQVLARLTAEPGSGAKPSKFELAMRAANIKRLLDEATTDADLDRAVDKLLEEGQTAASSAQIAKAANPGNTDPWKPVLAAYTTQYAPRSLTPALRREWVQIFASEIKAGTRRVIDPATGQIREITQDHRDQNTQLRCAAYATEELRGRHPERQIN